MHFTTRLKKNPRFIEMTPLVDIVFLLLIFFIITSDTLPLKSLAVKAPELDLSTPALTVQVAVVVDAYEVIYLGSKKRIIDLASLESQLKKEIERYKILHGGATPTVVLYIDRAVSYDTFLQIFYAAQKAETPLRLAYKEACPCPN